MHLLRRRASDWRTWLLALLSVQYLALQLISGVEYWDAPRNLHWGLYLMEEPRFLLDAEDHYDRIYGFPPTDPALAPAGLALGRSTPLHPWWGPLYPLLFGLIWRLSGSYTAIQLVVPTLGGALVLLTYAFGRRYLGRGAGLLAALLLAIFPVYREHAVLAFVEPISALLLLGAFWAYLERRSALAAALGTLAGLGKIDLLPLYFGTVGLSAALGWRELREPGRLRHVAICLLAPALLLLPWLITIYGIYERPTTVAGGPRLALFALVSRLTVEQIFMLPAGLTLGLLGLVALPVGVALGRRDEGRPEVVRLLGIWLGLGLLVMLVYMAMPGASNNPRIFIPALPALCLLAARGLGLMAWRWRTSLTGALLTLFTLSSAAGLIFQLAMADLQRATMPAWDALREAPRCAVLTEHYWLAALYARQPAAWFVKDPAFQRNTLHNLPNFQRFLAAAPVCHILLPADDANRAALLESTPALRLYARLPFGRAIEFDRSPATAPEVRAYLEATFAQRSLGAYVLFTTRDE